MSAHTTALIAAAIGAGGGHEGDASINWFEIGSMALNFILLFGFLAYRLRPVVRDGLADRRKKLEERMREAQQKQAEAEARLEEYNRKIANLEQEFKAVVESYEAQAKADQARMEQEAERAIERLARESDFTIQQEMRKVERAIRTAAVEATLQQAEGLIRSDMTDDDQRRLTEEYIAQLDRTSAN